jgi:excisionase family DNA binding protein
MNATSFDDLVSVREAAELLRVSESTVWRWIHDGDVPSYRVGRKRVYVKRADLAPRRQSRGHGHVRQETSNATEASATLARAAELLQRVRAMHEQYLEEHGGQFMPDSSEEINAAREERSRELG